MSVSQLLAGAAVVPFAMAVAVIVIGLARVPAGGRSGPAELVAALGLALEFLLAAGLLRLAALQELQEFAAVAAIIVLRRIIGAGLRQGLRALGATRFKRLRA